jgi:hypothetical protein
VVLSPAPEHFYVLNRKVKKAIEIYLEVEAEKRKENTLI